MVVLKAEPLGSPRRSRGAVGLLVISNYLIRFCELLPASLAARACPFVAWPRYSSPVSVRPVSVVLSEICRPLR